MQINKKTVECNTRAKITDMNNQMNNFARHFFPAFLFRVLERAFASHSLFEANDSRSLIGVAHSQAQFTHFKFLIIGESASKALFQNVTRRK